MCCRNSRKEASLGILQFVTHWRGSLRGIRNQVQCESIALRRRAKSVRLPPPKIKSHYSQLWLCPFETVCGDKIHCGSGLSGRVEARAPFYRTRKRLQSQLSALTCLLLSASPTRWLRSRRQSSLKSQKGLHGPSKFDEAQTGKSLPTTPRPRSVKHHDPRWTTSFQYPSE